MRLLLRLLLLFAIAVGLAVASRFNPGNVVFFYPPYRIDLSLNFFLLLLAVLFWLCFLLINALSITQKMPSRVAAYRRDKREREGNRALRDSLKALFEGRFGHAEKAATRAGVSPDNTGLAALIGARAAHRMQQTARRDDWLNIAAEDSGLRTARLMTALELLVDDHQPERALTAVDELNASGTRHIHVLRLALKASYQARHWSEVLRLVRTLDKNNAMHPAASRRLRELAYDALLSDRSNDAESIRRVWAGVPISDRTTPLVAVRAAEAFGSRGLADEARSIVERALAVEWDDRLIMAYRGVAAAEGSAALLAQIEHCEAWLMQRPTDPELALTLATLCLKQKLWGKAQRHLEHALSDASETETLRAIHLKLAQLHESLNQAEQASAHYRQCALAGLLDQVHPSVRRLS
ncbi:heme biosynthesis HemY N-terminal domain-containing protein [Actimicrobium sp. CCC2.4]|uniref:heme biosynthesis HemY N-terminal domain-containing protein n=1 Tax=Actimicrobium sp. CCC2.4 TaxID=3048606 RepID=UPI002AC96F28|nr:heme biosynthesis HemY N-terminal domain-containing protein [Actimicrobium sp. CCC2.4]MEB0136314.1 heme biosynthesis HemY N-terminal domain-containing protein [Actimicrobium sp. CCC2.4]WPX31137.1 heme biosynthesis HemY N-terminal domain-containing protein [Actimicrobium sp. CCC2.4]